MGNKDELRALFNRIAGAETMRQRTSIKGAAQEQMARKACVHRQWISRFETGKAGINLYSFFRYIEAIGIDLLELCRNIRDQFRIESAPIKKAAEKAKYKRYIEQTKKKPK
jgi:transcriptional regulator with XRE-family HTH domain